LLTDEAILDGIKDGKPLAELRQAWAKDLEAFRQRRAGFLLYR
jgi:hypothetical protein